MADLNKAEPSGIGYDLMTGYETVRKSDKPAAINTEDVRQKRDELTEAVVDLIDAGCFDMNPVGYGSSRCELPTS